MNGAYDAIAQIHPYCTWLVNTHISSHQSDVEDDVNGHLTKPIDNKKRLLEGDSSNISADRIETLYRILSAKI